MESVCPGLAGQSIQVLELGCTVEPSNQQRQHLLYCACVSQHEHISHPIDVVCRAGLLLTLIVAGSLVERSTVSLCGCCPERVGKCFFTHGFRNLCLEMVIESNADQLDD